MRDIAPCPFCGEPSELDTQRGYCQFPSGELGKAVSIYCSVDCPVEMVICCEDYPGEDPSVLADELVKCWNKREPKKEKDEPVTYQRGELPPRDSRDEHDKSL